MILFERPSTRARPISIFSLIFLALLPYGCVPQPHERVSVTVNSDGTWTRMAVFVAPIQKRTRGAPRPAAVRVSDSFAVPSGGRWHITTRNTRSAKRTIAERTVRLGARIENDIVVKDVSSSKPVGMEMKGKAGKRNTPGRHDPESLLTTNTAVVNRASPGHFTYSETIHWTGNEPAGFGDIDDEQIAVVKAGLPANFATDEDVKSIAKAIMREYIMAILGPPHPLLDQFSLMIRSQEKFNLLLEARITIGVSSVLNERFGDRMTIPERHEVTERLTAGIMKMNGATVSSSKSDTHAINRDKDRSGARILISIWLPGKITKTNGAVNARTGAVTWSFYPEAAALGDLKLTAESAKVERHVTDGRRFAEKSVQ